MNVDLSAMVLNTEAVFVPGRHVTVWGDWTGTGRFNDLREPAPIPHGTDYASVIESSVPVVVQHTRLDSRQDANALITTIAYADVA